MITKMQRLVVTGILSIYLTGAPYFAQAQSDDEAAGTTSEFEQNETSTSLDEARRLLAAPLPESADKRYALLQQQYRVARAIEDRVRQIEISRQLIDAGRGQANGENWITNYLTAEFTWGSSGKAFDACDAYISDKTLSIGTRASVALRQTYFAAQGRDRVILNRLWSNADDLSMKALKSGQPQPFLPIQRLQVRSELERFQGDNIAAVATLREASSLSRQQVQLTRKRSKNPKDATLLDAYGWLDGSQGMLVYALVRQGRSPEAIEIAQDNIQLWQSGQLSDGIGARWSYRLATSLNATQQYDAALTAARRADEMLEKSGASSASHTRWLARQEVLRALIGLKRWQDADVSYQQFLMGMPPDLLARTRASDWRLIALLAAKNGRLDIALDQVEHIYKYRHRLYGDQHPQTQEAAGIRAVVHLLRGDTRQAMSDYETLFTATLDTPGGWLDLDIRGIRGYVFGIAFEEFMNHVAERALKGEKIDPKMSVRALQVADRSNLSVTQRALTDSTARVLAKTPELRNLIEQEQIQRQSVSATFSKINGLLTQEDQLRRDARKETFKQLPEADRKLHAERLKMLKTQIKELQSEANTARDALKEKRRQIADAFPAFADLVTPTTPDIDTLRRLLGPGEALLLIHPMDSATFVWLVGNDGHDGFTASRMNRSDIADRTNELRGIMDIGAEPRGFEPALKLEPMYALYRELLAPLDAQLLNVQSLMIATQGPLASVPLAALITRPPTAGTPPAWLVRQMAVTLLPSPSSLQALRRVEHPLVAAKPLLGFGDPVFKIQAPVKHSSKESAKNKQVALPSVPAKHASGAPLTAGATRYDADWGFRYGDIPQLPETRNELLAVAAALGADAKTDLVLGSKATRRAVLDANLLDRRTVAFATHGLMPGELPGISKPSLAMSATVDDKESPLLELDDVLGLRLNAQWVLLSACNTATGEKGGGAMSGLVRGFFFAGARSVLATHWSVDSEASAALSSATFGQYGQGGISRSESLRQAQLAMIDGKLGEGRWTHPFYWAPYALFGDPLR